MTSNRRGMPRVPFYRRGMGPVVWALSTPLDSRKWTGFEEVREGGYESEQSSCSEPWLQTYKAVRSAAVWVSWLSVAAHEASRARACAVGEAGCAE